MIDRHLNLFVGYERREPFHEDNVTRALVCTLRNCLRLTRAFVQTLIDPNLILGEGEDVQCYLQTRLPGRGVSGYA